MIIPLTYADLKKEMLAELSEIAVKIHNRPHKWRKYQPYSLEYTWIIDQVIKVLGFIIKKNHRRRRWCRHGTILFCSQRSRNL